MNSSQAQANVFTIERQLRDLQWELDSAQVAYKNALIEETVTRILSDLDAFETTSRTHLTDEAQSNEVKRALIKQALDTLAMRIS
jgi:hypothetical protein